MRKSLENNYFQSNKSSKSIVSKYSRLTKINPEEPIEKSEHIYFKEDPMLNQIYQRVSSGKPKENQQSKNHLFKAQGIIEDLMSRHEKAKAKLQRIKEQAEREYEQGCTFVPKHISNQKYVVTGDVLKRSQVWLKEKKRKQLELREEVANNSLRQCTFAPKFSSKKQSESYLRSRELSRSLTPKSSSFIKYPKQTSPFKGNPSQKSIRRDFTEIQYEMAKKSLISRMMGSLN